MTAAEFAGRVQGSKGSNPLDCALHFYRLGMSVIPVPRPSATGDGKTPSLRWKRYQTERATEDQIRAWFQTDQNIAIITGTVSGVVVVDSDSPAALRWTTRHLHYTPWQVQTTRGFHLFYRYPAVAVRNKAKVDTRDGRLDLDVRGDGGYVIAPGSVHASGHVYQFAGDWSVPRSQLPSFWPGWLVRPRRSTRTPPRQRLTGDVVERARRYLAACPLPEIGAGSDMAVLSAACRLVRGFGLFPSEAVSLLWEWTGGRPGFTHEWVERKVVNAVRYGTEPVGGLR